MPEIDASCIEHGAEYREGAEEEGALLCLGLGDTGQTVGARRRPELGRVLRLGFGAGILSAGHYLPGVFDRRT